MKTTSEQGFFIDELNISCILSQLVVQTTTDQDNIKQFNLPSAPVK